jgi:drug/metabolite transporter (DMT)-like permease
MALVPILLIALSALTHAYWNFLTKRVQATDAFLALSVLASAILFLPVFIAVGIPSPLPPLKYGWLILVAATYAPVFFFFLGNAYKRGNLSLVYPVTRAGQLLFLPILGLIFIGERIDWLGGAAMALITVGIVIIQLEKLDRQSARELLAGVAQPAIGYAFFAAFVAAAYVLWDKNALNFLPAFFYNYVYTALSGLVYCAWVAIRTSPQALIDEFRRNPVTILLVGLFSMVSYLLVLFALQTDKASYVIALRQLSIAISALMGKFWLGERFSGHRWAGLVVLLAGCMLVSLAS